MLYFTRIAAKRAPDNLQIRSFIAVLFPVYLLMAIGKIDIDPEALRAAVEQHFELFLLAYGTDALQYKHH